MPPRADILAAALRATTNERNKSYGEPSSNMTEAQLFIDQFWAIWERAKKPMPPPGFEHAIDNVLAKLVRIAHGDHFHEDSYTDVCGYTSIAWECILAYAAEVAVPEEFVPHPEDPSRPSAEGGPGGRSAG